MHTLNGTFEQSNAGSPAFSTDLLRSWPDTAYSGEAGGSARAHNVVREILTHLEDVRVHVNLWEGGAIVTRMWPAGGLGIQGRSVKVSPDGVMDLDPDWGHESSEIKPGVQEFDASKAAAWLGEATRS